MTLVGLGLVIVVLALWKMRLIVVLLLFAIVIASAMRPGVEALQRRGIPRSGGIAIHYVALFGLLAGLLWLAVPRALEEVRDAVSALPETRSELRQEATDSGGLKHAAAGRPRTAARDASLAGEADRAGRRDHASRRRGVRRRLLRLRQRGVLDLRARSCGAGAPFPRPAAETQGRQRHVESDRPEARCVRAGTAAPRRARRRHALDRVLGDRHAVLATRRQSSRASSSSSRSSAPWPPGRSRWASASPRRGRRLRTPPSRS